MSFIFKDQGLEFFDPEKPGKLQLKGVQYRTASVDPPSIPTVSSAETAVTLRGVSVDDIVIANVPAALETGLAFSGIRVSAADTIQVRLTNVTGLAVDGAARTWEFLIFKLAGYG